ncbi:TIGR03621 family F420-dependent LLM class oxidoreductase [Dactylosporangium sp. NPDC000244]|uniref:TIGR03621 family F420-dependent LLM class oxidoreductase n=1 Tax=Dactylosporangium sp. NPDC000244 TaxID=3154365 RepID=UPI00332B874A
MTQPFTFSVATGGETSGGPSSKAWLELARSVEGLGYDALYLNDHVEQPLAALPALAAAAAVTTTLRLGPRVANNDVRSPVLLAHEIATLDVLSDGRAELGLGAGWRAEDHRAAGIRFDDGPRRAARFAESVAVVDRLLRGEPLSYTGAHYTVELTEPFVTVQRPRIPLTVGAGGPRLLRLAAEHADTVSLTARSLPGGGADEADLDPARLDEKVAVVRAAAAAHGRSPRLHHVVWECMITPQPGPLLEMYAGAMGITVAQLRAQPSLIIGSVESVTEDLLARRERWGLSSVSVPHTALQHFAPVVAALAGR